MTEQAYIQAVRNVYLQLPNTHWRFNCSDRCLASSLYQRSFSLELVRSALLLATARRLIARHGRTSSAPSVLFPTSFRSWSKSDSNPCRLDTCDVWKPRSVPLCSSHAANSQCYRKPALYQKPRFLMRAHNRGITEEPVVASIAYSATKRNRNDL